MATPPHSAKSPQLPQRPRQVLVLVLPGVHLQDLAGPVQVFWEAAGLGGAYRVRHVSAELEVRSAQGLLLGGLEPLPEVQADDLVLVPGMASAGLDQLRPPVAWLRSARVAGARVVSVCSGAFALGRAGLLDGRRCTTHWKLTARLRRDFPAAQVQEGRLFVEHGGVVTSAGVAAGIDLALALVEADFGPLVAARVAREMVVYLRRGGDQEQLSVYLDHRTHLHPGVHLVQDFIVQHPERKLSLPALARLAAMSPRNLARVFQRATGLTPKQYAARVKLQVSRDLLADPRRSLEDIAGSCGFDDPRQLRRLWRQVYGMSISSYRAARSRGERSPPC